MSNSERSYTVGVYRVSIMLETGSIFSGEVVADNLPGEDVLIGRDIISRLDFHITKDDNGVPFCVIEDKSITE